MNILHTEWMKSRGGQPKRVLQELKILKTSSHTPYIATPKDSWLAQEAKKENIKVFEINFNGALDIKNTIKLYKIIQRYNIDIIHTHSSKDSYPALYAAKLARRKVIRSRHMDLTKKAGFIYNLADAIIVTGNKIKTELINQGIHTPIYSIPSYPSKDKFYPDSNKRELFRKRYNTKNIVVGALTGLKKDKRPHLLIDALKNLNVDIFVAGVNNDPIYEKEIEQLSKNSNFKFLGYTDPHLFLNGIDIYACPSKKEGIPQSIMQAMLCKKAVVSMDVGSIQDLNIKNNLLLAKNIQEFYNLLQKLVQNPSLIQKLGEKNYKIASQYFHEKRLKKEILDIYENL